MGMDENTPRTEYRIPEDNFADFTAKMNRLITRANKLGVAAPVVTETGTETTPIMGTDALGRSVDTGRVRLWHLVSVTGEAPKLAGWTFAAVIELDHEAPDAPNVVHVVTGETDPAWRTLAERCDHCHVNSRRRNKLVVVDHDNGDRKVVGTTCLRDFLGHTAPENVAAWAEYLTDLDGLGEFEDEDYTPRLGGGGEDRWDAPTYLGWVARSVRESGWVARSAVRFGGTATADDALYLLGLASGSVRLGRNEVRPAPLTDAEIAEGAAAAAWAASVDPAGNDYLANLNAVALKPSLRRKDLGLAASILSAYAKVQERELERAARAASTAASVHVGTVGERIELTGTVTFVRYFDGDYGTRALVKILASGNVLTWWCSNADKAPAQGDTVTGKATVKAHEDYQGTAQTLITRAKLTVVEAA